MKLSLFLMALAVGMATWAFRALPILLMRGEARPGGLFARFLAATGPAAIATLLVASLLPHVGPQSQDLAPLAAGILATVATFWLRPSVIVATIAGALAYGAIIALAP